VIAMARASVVIAALAPRIPRNMKQRYV